MHVPSEELSYVRLQADNSLMSRTGTGPGRRRSGKNSIPRDAAVSSRKQPVRAGARSRPATSLRVYKLCNSGMIWAF